MNNKTPQPKTEQKLLAIITGVVQDAQLVRVGQRISKQPFVIEAVSKLEALMVQERIEQVEQMEKAMVQLGLNGFDRQRMQVTIGHLKSLLPALTRKQVAGGDNNG